MCRKNSFISKITAVLLVLICVFMSLPFSSFAAGTPFIDVKSNHWAYPYVEYVYANKYMVGTHPTIFGGDVVATRAMVVTILAKMAGAKLGPNSETEFPDVAVNQYYTGAVNWAHRKGIVKGTDKGRFLPNQPVTREQLAVMLQAFGKYLGYSTSYQDETLLLLYIDEWTTANYARGALAWAVDYSLMVGSDYHIMPKKGVTRYELAAIIKTFMNSKNAKHQPVPVIHFVRFLNYDGSVIQQSYVKDGSPAIYFQTTPYRPEDNDYMYEFSGWNKSFNSIKANTDITAQFKATEKPKRRIDPSKPMLALTFDDGPGPYTNMILDVLEQYNCACTFFEVGQNVGKYPYELKREVAIGCEVANHTYSHPQLTNCSATTIRNEIQKTNNAIANIIGFSPRLLRPPYGSRNATVDANVGMPEIIWSVDTNDWRAQNKNVTYLYNYVMSHCYDGAIILMHSIHLTSAQSIAKIVPGLINKGYQLVTVSELAEYKGYNLKNGSYYYSFK